MNKPPKTDLRIGLRLYATRQPGVGGVVKKSPSGFIVAEVLKTSLEPGGKGYPLYVLYKVNRNTLEAVRELEAELRCKIVYWGLKDKRAVTSQFVQCTRMRREPPKKLSGRGWRAFLAALTPRVLEPSDFAGNSFRILIEKVKAGRLSSIKEELEEALRERRLPNYYGYQRFGVRNPNHVLGRCIVKASREPDCPSIEKIKKLDRKYRVLAVNAYQSYLFNLALSIVYERFSGLPPSAIGFKTCRKPFPHACGEPLRAESCMTDCVPAAPIPGYAYKSRGDPYSEALDEVLRSEEVKPSDFYVDRMPEVSAEGYWRPAALLGRVLIRGLSGSRALIVLSIQRGSYATIMLRELMKPSDPVSSGLTS